MKPFFQDLFEYNHHFNQKLWTAFGDNHDRISDKAVKLLNHIVNAHQIWNNRIDPKQETFGVWQLHSFEGLKNIDQTNYEHTLKIISTFDLYQTVTYSNTHGQTFHNTIHTILFHVVNHSTYHRAQVATDFKQRGIEPLITDYIFYKR